MSDKQLNTLMGKSDEAKKQKELDALKAEYTVKMEQADSLIEKLKTTLEHNEKVAITKHPEKAVPPEVRVVGGNMTPISPLDAIADPYLTEAPSRHFRWVNDHESLRPLRRHQGYEPQLNAESKEVSYMDLTLMSMPKKRYEETIEAPKKEKQAFRRKAVSSRFEEMAKEAGGEAVGEIKFDKKESLE